MIFAALLTVALARPVPAGVYGAPGDKWDDGRLACKAAPADLRRGFAHRTLPCGAFAVLCGPRGCAIGVRVDAGPYGAVTARGYKVRVGKLKAGERYRGEVDLRPELATQLGYTSGPVLFRPM